MKNRLLIKYALLCLPFIIGSIMFSLEIYNIISSILFFVGGYIAIKNLCDYRKWKKNKKIVLENNIVVPKEKKNYRNSENIIGLKRTRIHHRVRKRIKNIDF